MLDSKNRLKSIKRELATVAFGLTQAAARPVEASSDAQSQEVISDLLGGAVALINAQRGLIVVPTQPGDHFQVIAALGLEAAQAWTGGGVSEPILQTVQREGRGILTHTAGQDPTLDRLRSVLCVPLVKDGDQWGLLYLDNPARRGAFRESQLRLLKDYALLTMNLLETA